MRPRSLRDEDGAALLVVFAAIFLTSVLSSGLVLLTSMEIRIASNYRESTELTYVARSAFDVVTAALGESTDLSVSLASGTSPTLFGRSSPAGMPSSSVPDVGAETTVLQTMWDRPGSWGANNPRWRPFADGFFESVLPSTVRGHPSYVIAWIADDEFETDGNPTADSNGQVRVHVESFGSLGARQALDGIIVRRRPFPAPLASVGLREGDRFAP